MRRDELAHIIRASCDVLGVQEVLILGSQTLLGRWNEYELPRKATISREADVAAWGPYEPDEIEEMSHALSGAIGQDSPFDQLHGIYVDGVSPSTADLPAGWRARLEAFSDITTNYLTGWCLNPEDACVAKLAAGRDHDYPFVAAVLDDGLISRDILLERARTLNDAATSARVVAWIEAYESPTKA